MSEWYTNDPEIIKWVTEIRAKYEELMKQVKNTKRKLKKPKMLRNKDETI